MFSEAGVELKWIGAAITVEAPSIAAKNRMLFSQHAKFRKQEVSDVAYSTAIYIGEVVHIVFLIPPIPYNSKE